MKRAFRIANHASKGSMATTAAEENPVILSVGSVIVVVVDIVELQNNLTYEYGLMDKS